MSCSVLVLDEATSALDTESEAAVQAALTATRPQYSASSLRAVEQAVAAALIHLSCMII